MRVGTRLTVSKTLNSGVLRALALPLRYRTPRLYSWLNAFRKQLITGRAELDAHQLRAIQLFSERTSVAGSRVLEIGTDPTLRVVKHLLQEGAASVVGVNPSSALPQDASSLLAQGSKVALVRSDATHLPFPDGSFDAAFSISTFEHILDLPAVLAEVHRVLKVGAVFYSSYGPIWSSGKGHHVNAESGEHEVRHFIPETNPLPDFCHLLLTPEELRVALSGRTHPDLVEPIVAWVSSSPNINRLFHHSYLDVFAASSFSLESLTPQSDPVDPQLDRILRFKFPDEDGFDVTNADVVLVKKG